MSDFNRAQTALLCDQLAVYSTFCGTTENMTFNSSPVASGYKHFFVSNNQDVLTAASKVGWVPILINLEVSDNPVVSAQQAKIAKALPGVIPALSDFRYLFYKDDKVDLNVARMPAFVDALLTSGAPISIRKHPYWPANVLYEFGAAMGQPRYKAQFLQTAKYIADEVDAGYQLGCDNLFWTSAILRDMRHPDAQKINDCWYSHILRCGIECQISFHFIAQRFPNIVLLPDVLT